MSDIYVYEATATSCDDLGLCGAITPIECKFTEIANGMESITAQVTTDALGKYLYLTEGRIVKAFVPVRTTPEISNGTFVSVAEIWTVKSGASKQNRKIWSKQASGKGKCLYTLAVGDTVNVISAPAESERWKVTHTYTQKKKTVTVTGWMVHDATTLEDTAQRVQLPATVTGIETVAPSWKVAAQLFRITNVSKDVDTVTVEAQHISYDMMYNITTYDENGQKTLQQAADGIIAACLDKGNVCDIKTNITGNKTGFHWANKDPITALLDPEDGLVSRWSGQVVRNNEDIVILDEAGSNRGMTFRYGDNVTGIDVKVDMSNVSTAIRPIGETKDGKPIVLEKSYKLDATYTTATEIAGDLRGLVLSPRFDSGNTRTVPFERIYALQGDDCTESDTLNIATIRQRLLEQAKDALKNGADLPETSVDVDIMILGQSERYKEFRDLEQVFLFDTVRVRHPSMNVDMNVTVSEIEWDCVNDRLMSIKLGALQNLQTSVASWQISSVNGGKIIAGTIGAQSIGDDAISARTIIADSITADAIQANAVTADKVAAGILTAKRGEINQLTSAMVESHEIATDTIASALAGFDILRATSFNATSANIKSIIADVLHIGTEAAEAIYADYIKAKYIYAENAALDSVVLLGDDGNYHKIHVGTDGTMTTSIVSVSAAEIQAGITDPTRTDGDGTRTIINDTNVYKKTETSQSAYLGALAVCGALDAKSIQTDVLFADEATISNLRATTVTMTDSARAIQFGHMVDDFRDGMELVRDQGGGYYLDIGQLSAGNVARIDQDGFRVLLQGETYSHLGANFVQFGNYQLRKSADGGMVFKLKEG